MPQSLIVLRRMSFLPRSRADVKDRAMPRFRGQTSPGSSLSVPGACARVHRVAEIADIAGIAGIAGIWFFRSRRFRAPPTARRGAFGAIREWSHSHPRGAAELGAPGRDGDHVRIQRDLVSFRRTSLIP